MVVCGPSEARLRPKPGSAAVNGRAQVAAIGAPPPPRAWGTCLRRGDPETYRAPRADAPERTSAAVDDRRSGRLSRAGPAPTAVDALRSSERLRIRRKGALPCNPGYHDLGAQMVADRGPKPSLTCAYVARHLTSLIAACRPLTASGRPAEAGGARKRGVSRPHRRLDQVRLALSLDLPVKWGCRARRDARIPF